MRPEAQNQPGRKSAPATRRDVWLVGRQDPFVILGVQ
jgi:hypothetical protein